MPTRLRNPPREPAPRGSSEGGRSRARRPAAAPPIAEDANRRDLLIRTAARLFREKGFDATTVRDIAAAVGMRSGSPFYHFASKQAMLLAVMEEGLRQGLDVMQSVLARKLPQRARFRALVRTHLGIILERGNDFIPVMLYDWHALDAEHRRAIIAMKDRYDTVWQSMTRELARAQLLRGDPKVARLMILGAMNFTATWYRAEGSLSIDALADEIVEVFLQPDRK
jgi:TetR/AcrR family transcriptional regulator, cholesterol catabolism regulator